MIKNIEINFTSSNAEEIKTALKAKDGKLKSFLKIDDIYSNLPIFEFTTKDEIESGRYHFKVDDELSFSYARIEFKLDENNIRNYYCSDYKVFLEDIKPKLDKQF